MTSRLLLALSLFTCVGVLGCASDSSPTPVSTKEPGPPEDNDPSRPNLNRDSGGDGDGDEHTDAGDAQLPEELDAGGDAEVPDAGRYPWIDPDAGPGSPDNPNGGACKFFDAAEVHLWNKSGTSTAQSGIVNRLELVRTCWTPSTIPSAPVVHPLTGRMWFIDWDEGQTAVSIRVDAAGNAVRTGYRTELFEWETPSCWKVTGLKLHPTTGDIYYACSPDCDPDGIYDICADGPWFHADGALATNESVLHVGTGAYLVRGEGFLGLAVQKAGGDEPPVQVSYAGEIEEESTYVAQPRAHDDGFWVVSGQYVWLDDYYESAGYIAQHRFFVDEDGVATLDGDFPPVDYYAVPEGVRAIDAGRKVLDAEGRLYLDATNVIFRLDVDGLQEVVYEAPVPQEDVGEDEALPITGGFYGTTPGYLVTGP